MPLSFEDACLQIRACFGSFSQAYRSTYFAFRSNWTLLPHHVIDSWEQVLEDGKSYMVGKDVPMERFIKASRSPLNAWQKIAYQWARDNPTEMLIFNTFDKHWLVFQEGEFVTFHLPDQDHGGENTYVTLEGKSKIHINND